jgi:uncharacterized membrane protein
MNKTTEEFQEQKTAVDEFTVKESTPLVVQNLAGEVESPSHTQEIVPLLEKHKINIDLYKFYVDTIFKVGTAYLVAITTILTLIQALFKDTTLTVISSLIFIVVGITLTYLGHKFEEHTRIYDEEIEQTKRGVGMSIGPEPVVLRRLVRFLTILSFVLPLIIGLIILIYFTNK